MNKIERIKELTNVLQNASYAYYGQDRPIMSDKEYDDLFEELENLEHHTGVILAGSPTQKVQGYILDGLEKVKHSKPMLSANKTKSIDDVKKFIGDRTCVISWKLDGLTIVLRYKDGKFVQAITRGQGDIGEDVTHTMRMCKNIPMKIPYHTNIEVRGECILPWEEFDRINSRLTDQYKHPRNLAAGTVRQLNSNVAKERNIIFKVFELVQDGIYNKSKEDSYLIEHIMNINESFEYLSECGFDVVEHEYVTKDNVEDIVSKYNPENYYLPVDGLIFTYNDYLYGKRLGETTHHPLNMLAMKWTDELYETMLTDIEWSTSRTGLINPVAIFTPVDLDGAITSKATLHNVSYIEDLELGIGDTIQVYRSNMVIPKVHENLTRSNSFKLPEKCPCCGGSVEIHNENGSKTLHCINPDCKAKLLSKLIHAVSKHALNIDGLSEATIEKFINLGWISSIKDVYHLSDYKNKMVTLEGFGKKSVDKLLKSIDLSRNTTLSRFLYAQSINLIGKTASKDIEKACDYNIDKFRTIVSLEQNRAFTWLDGFGEEMNKSLINWWNEHHYEFCDLAKEFTFEIPIQINSAVENKSLEDVNFVVTGKLLHFSNRDELINKITSLGGKVTGSVTSKTDFLINNDSESSSSKNIKAKKLGVSIITEDEFISKFLNS